MLNTQPALSDFSLYLLKGLCSDLREDQMDDRVHGVGHSPRWILGHLAVAIDLAIQCCGGSPARPEAWHKAFGMGSNEGDPHGPRPTKTELLAAIESGVARVTESLKSITPGDLARPHGVGPLAGSPIKTVEDLLALLLTSHTTFHLGQLSAWRRQKGFPALF